MGKNPAFLFYPGDWTRDLDDQDLEVEGAWIRICCRLWWSETRGQSTKPLREWARILRKTEKKTTEILKILIEKGIASGSVLDNQNSTIISRRMVKDYEISQLRREVGKLGGNPSLKKTSNKLLNQSDNQNSTLSVSVSVSPSNKEKILKKKVFQKPTLDQVKTYCYERGNEVHPEVWFDHYESNGWLVGKNPMKDWQAAVRTWEKSHGNNGNGNGQKRFQRNPASVSREAGSQRSDDPEVEKIKALFRQKANDNRNASILAADGNPGDVPDFNP